MKFPYLAPRTALGPIRLDTYVDRERVNVMMDDVRVREGGQERITPEFKAWVDRQTRKHRQK